MMSFRMQNLKTKSVSSSITHRRILTTALPVTLASATTPLVAAVDTAVIGQLGDASLIGGVAAANVLVNFIFFTFNFVRSSTVGMVAQALGAGRPVEGLHVVVRAATISLIIGALAVLCSRPIAEAGFMLLDIEGDVREAGDAYFHVRVLSAPMLLAHFSVVGWLFGQRRMFEGIALEILLNATNIAATLFFVRSLHLSVEGAALGTVFAEAMTGIIGLSLVVRAMQTERMISIGAALRDREKLLVMVRVNGDILIRSLLLLGSFAWFTRTSAAFGPTVLAANVVLMTLFNFSGAVVGGVATSAQQIAGEAIGAGDRRAMSRGVQLSLLWGSAAGLLTMVCYLAVRDEFLALMSANEIVRATAREIFWFAALCGPAGAAAFIFDGVYIGASWSRSLRNVMLLSVGAFIGLSWALLPLFGNAGLWISFLIFLLMRGVLLWLFLARNSAAGPPPYPTPVDQAQ